ncbi:SDR family oxidoreductase [bacterium]|nr:SDR family oxidoreductase [bacterium]
MSAQDCFRGRNCVVTGAASGIGRAITEALLQAGAVVVMADRDAKLLAGAVDELAAHAGRVHSAVVDVTQQAQVQQMIEAAATRHGTLDFLFNNAGIGFGKLYADATLDEWRRIIDINLWGVIYGVHAALPIMHRQGRGHIVNTASIAGLVPLACQVLYCATKFAVVGLSESLRIELADEGICVSVVCPSEVVSRIWGPKMPANAIPADEAAREILAGVAAKQGIIALPESARQLWMQYRTDTPASEAFLLDMARQRRKTILSSATYF